MQLFIQTGFNLKYPASLWGLWMAGKGGGRVNEYTTFDTVCGMPNGNVVRHFYLSFSPK